MLSLEDFSVYRQVFEAKFLPSYLLWDRSGEMWTSISKEIEGLKFVDANPNSIQFETPTFYMLVEHSLLRLTSKDNTSYDDFENKTNLLFKTVVRFLEVELFTRLGLRTIWAKTFPTLTEAREVFSSFQLVRELPSEPFGVKTDSTGIDLKFTWEDAHRGVMVGLRSEKRHTEPLVPWELRSEIDTSYRDRFSLVVDVDCYTLSQVRRDQVDVREWMGSSLRQVKKALSKEIFR